MPTTAYLYIIIIIIDRTTREIPYGAASADNVIIRFWTTRQTREYNIVVSSRPSVTLTSLLRRRKHDRLRAFLTTYNFLPF